MKEVSLDIFRLKNGGGKGIYGNNQFKHQLCKQQLVVKLKNNTEKWHNSYFFSTLLSYLLCMCMCAALQQVGDATHKIAALFYCVGVTVSLMTVSQKVLIGRLCVRGVTIQPAAGQEQQAAD